MPKLKIGGDSREPIELHYEDHGSGRPVVLIHGWPLSSRSWEAQVPALVDADHRVVTYDRRGFGASSQPWTGYDYDTFADDLHALLTELDLKDATLVGFSMGGGEVARYLAKHGSARIARAVFAAAVPPFLYKSADNPDGGLDDATIAQFEGGVKGDRLAFLEAFTANFFKAGDKVLVSESQRVYARNIAAFASPKGTLDCIAAFGRTDLSRRPGENQGADARDPRRLRRHRAVRGQRQAHRQGDRRLQAQPDQGRPARAEPQPRGGVQQEPARLPGRLTTRVCKSATRS